MHYILRIYNPNLIELILKPVLMYLNVFSNWLFVETNLKSKRYTIRQYKGSFLQNSNVHRKVTSLL